MALKDWLSEGPAVAVFAVPAALQPESFSITAKTTITAAATKRNNITGNRRGEALAGNLPKGCPLLGDEVPDGCRFEARFFARMVQEGVLPTADGPCPIRQSCKVTLTP